ncbi:MAG TPA: c-type cytochrome [Polyangiaceae bacterium]|nr:c-type cytochrome [Polyangiaceae bacterium]
MRRNVVLGRVVFGCIAAAALAFACSSDNSSNNNVEDSGTGGSSTGGSSTGGASAGGKSSGGANAGGANAGAGGSSTGGSSSGGTSSGGTAGSGGSHETDSGLDGGAPISLCGSMSDQVACGKYIVEHIEACGDCHTPRLQTGAPDTSKLLAGTASFADLVPNDDSMGNIPAPNLTQLKTLGWTAQDVENAIRDGKAKDGTGLFPAMPYTTMHNMADVDAAAVAAYILQLTPITNDVGTRQPLPGNLAASLPIAPVNASDVPDPVIEKTDPSYDDAMRGKYIAGDLGPCLECHTEQLQNGAPNMAKAFQGGRSFAPAFDVVSANITPDKETGQADYTPGAIKTLLQTGKMVEGGTICPPMPVGPAGAFGGLTDADALAIGAYITHLAPKMNGPDGGFPMCMMPMMDGGMMDGGMDSGMDSGKH